MRTHDDCEIIDYETVLYTLLFSSINEPIWRLSTRGSFLVRSLYNYFIKNDAMKTIFLFWQIWKVNAPYVVAFFVWEACHWCTLIVLISWCKEGKYWWMDVFYSRGRQSFVITFFFGAYLCISYEPWLTGYWRSIGWMAGSVREEIWVWKGISGGKNHVTLIPLTFFWVAYKKRNMWVFEEM